MKILSKNAAHIIAISENTKNDLMRIYGISDDKITVIHHGGPELIMFEKKPQLEGRNVTLYLAPQGNS